MKKIPTLFRRDPEDMRHVLPEVTRGCEWVLAGEGVPTRKYDGTCVMFDGERWWARREVKPDKDPPLNFREVEHDETTGKTVGWEPIEQSPFAKFHAEARGLGEWRPGTYELIGPKVNGNPERADRHTMILHGFSPVHAPFPVGDVQGAYDALREALTGPTFEGVEGVVWHHSDGRMAKLKRRDFARVPAPTG